MNEEHRDAEEVLMVIKRATMFADPIMKISAIGVAKMIQFLARMVKEKIIDKRDFKSFENFVKRTDGDFDVINIPVEQTGENMKRFGEHNDAIKEFEGLREQGVHFYEMPDLNMHGNSSLNNQRAGRGLMTPGEIKRMDRKKCLIFMEGQYPIMDWKNLPFNTAAWKESEKLAGKNGYKHPVRVVYNPETMTYRTILHKKEFQTLDKEDVEFYKQAEKTDKSIKVLEINEEDFLYLNFDSVPKPTEEELIEKIEKSRKEMQQSQESEKELEEQQIEEEKTQEENVPNFGTEENQPDKEESEEWDLSGTINQCIIRYASRLDENQINEILLGLENGLTDKQVKAYFTLPANKMSQYRRAYQFGQK